MESVNDIQKNQQELNESLAQICEENGIKNLQITSLGNSIASGYSALNPTKPLLLRNETLNSTMQKHGITLTRYQFARGQNNNDEHVFEWIVTNLTESQMNRMNRNDFGHTNTSMSTVEMTDQKLDEYYPQTPTPDRGLQDIILDSQKDKANIVVYNGGTGSFLDGVTRGGNISQMLTYGIKRDTYGIESVLNLIQANNRKNGTNTQVYLCGAPDYLGLKLTSAINNKLKKIAEKYANVVYVEPVKANFIYKNGIDIHYSDEEYKKFNSNIIKAIVENYEITKAMINIDREVYDFNEQLELYNQSQIENLERTSNYIFYKLIKESSQLETSKALKFLNQAKNYLSERAPYDFFYVGKGNIINSIENAKKFK